MRAALDAAGGDAIPHNFVPTAPAYDPRSGQRRGSMPRSSPRNPQTMAILQLLGVEYNLDHAANAAAAAPSWLQRSGAQPLLVVGQLVAFLPNRSLPAIGRVYTCHPSSHVVYSECAATAAVDLYPL